jgi:hypothetical protein
MILRAASGPQPAARIQVRVTISWDAHFNLVRDDRHDKVMRALKTTAAKR